MLHRIPLAIVTVGINPLFLRITICYVALRYRYQFIAKAHQETLSFSLLLRHHFIYALNIFAPISTCKQLPLIHRSAHLLLLNRLEQIVYTVHLKCFKRILVISCCKYHGGSHRHFIKNLERIAIREVYIHKHQVGRRIALKPLHAIYNRI